MTIGEIVALLASAVAIITSIYRGKKERAKLDAEASDAYAAAATKLASSYDKQLTQMQSQIDSLNAIVIDYKTHMVWQQSQLDVQAASIAAMKVMSATQTAEIESSKKEIGKLNKWIVLLCDKIRDLGGTPPPCPE